MTGAGWAPEVETLVETVVLVRATPLRMGSRKVRKGLTGAMASPTGSEVMTSIRGRRVSLPGLVGKASLVRLSFSWSAWSSEACDFLGRLRVPHLAVPSDPFLMAPRLVLLYRADQTAAWPTSLASEDV